MRTQFKINRGYTAHEHIDDFGIINMNGRIYDPVLARFLSLDPYVQAPDFTQGFNRYAYCLNNPFKYTDPTGEVFVIDDFIAAVAIGAIINTWVNIATNNIHSAGDFFMSVAIGGLSGAAGYGAGLGVSMALGGSSGFWAGGITGAAGNAAGSFVNGSANAWANGANFWDGMLSGLKSAGIGAVTGFITGGFTGGIRAKANGGNFWTAEGMVHEQTAKGAFNEPIKLGEGMRYDNQYAQEFSNAEFPKLGKGVVTDLYADGTLPSTDYKYVGEYVVGHHSGPNEYVNGMTVHNGTTFWGKSKGSTVYLMKSAFTSRGQLIEIMGHEYIHAAFNYYGRFNPDRQHAVAYQWSYNIAQKYNLSSVWYKQQYTYYNGLNGGMYPYTLKSIKAIFPYSW
jgi:RHS repeat-associated protein